MRMTLGKKEGHGEGIVLVLNAVNEDNDIEPSHLLFAASYTLWIHGWEASGKGGGRNCLPSFTRNTALVALLVVKRVLHQCTPLLHHHDPLLPVLASPPHLQLKDYVTTHLCQELPRPYPLQNLPADPSSSLLHLSCPIEYQRTIW